MRGHVVTYSVIPEALEKLIEASAEISFFKLCGIAESSNATAVRSRVKARDDVSMSDE